MAIQWQKIMSWKLESCILKVFKNIVHYEITQLHIIRLTTYHEEHFTLYIEIVQLLDALYFQPFIISQ